ASMSSDTEKILSSAMNLFFAKLSERPAIKLEGMEDYLKVPQYKALVNLEKKCSLMETDAASRVMDSKIAYLRAIQEVHTCEQRWLSEIENGIGVLKERDSFAKDVNSKMRKGDYSILQGGAVSSSSQEDAGPSTVATSSKPPIVPKVADGHRKEAESRPTAAKSNANPGITDIRKRLAQMNMDSPSRVPLQPKNVNRTAEIGATPKSGPLLSSKGSIDGSVLPNRAPTTPLSHSNWDVPAPNFDDTIDSEPAQPVFNSAFLPPRPLPKILQKITDEPEKEKEDEEAEHTFELPRPSLPYQTPTVPKSRPFLISSMRKSEKKADGEGGEGAATVPTRTPIPTPSSAAFASHSGDPTSSLGIMKLKRPVMSNLSKKTLGEL
ncbi:hypothetical protein PFISCL1PPCAC_28909, partial [Pristionchus fissidentatus]